MYFVISGAGIDMNFLSARDAGEKYTLEERQVTDWGGVLSSRYLQYVYKYMQLQTTIPAIDTYNALISIIKS